MIKRFCSLLLVFLILNIFSLQVFAENDSSSGSQIINAEFKTELNINKASKGEIIQFLSTQDYTLNGVTIPKGTIFSGEIEHFKKGRWAYRRAKAVVKINKMILPNGETYSVNATTQKHVLRSPFYTNAIKGVITFPLAVLTGAAGVVVIVTEALTIIGIIAIPPTGYGFSRAVGGITHGLNYKKEPGDEIKLRLKSVSKY